MHYENKINNTMKRFDTIIQFAQHICDIDDTVELNDEINITQATSLAKLFITMIAERGWWYTLFNFYISIILSNKLKNIDYNILRRVVRILLKHYRWYWIPFNSKRKQLSNLINSAKNKT